MIGMIDTQICIDKIQVMPIGGFILRNGSIENELRGCRNAAEHLSVPLRSRPFYYPKIPDHRGGARGGEGGEDQLKQRKCVEWNLVSFHICTQYDSITLTLPRNIVDEKYTSCAGRGGRKSSVDG